MTRRRLRLRFQLFLHRPSGVSVSRPDPEYVLVRTVSSVDAERLLGRDLVPGQFSHRWNDGYIASIAVRPMLPAERPPKEQRFSGYDWMVDNLLRHGQTEVPA